MYQRQEPDSGRDNIVGQIISGGSVGKHFCGIDAVIFQIADQCPDFNAILVTVINISGTCKGSNVSIVVV